MNEYRKSIIQNHFKKYIKMPARYQISASYAERESNEHVNLIKVLELLCINFHHI